MATVATNILIIGGVLAFSGAVVIGAQFLPPLTEPDADLFPEFRHYDTLKGEGADLPRIRAPAPITPQEVSSYCANQLSGVDCGCFARAAGHVLDQQTPEAIGWSYADKWDLARSQAMEDCS
jgi:hypothetical protein